MIEIQDIKNDLSVDRWHDRISEDPKRIYAFLLCTDEHEQFLSFVQKAWRTLNALSGKACDIFTFEQQEYPPQKLQSPRYLSIEGAKYGSPRIVPGYEYGYLVPQIAIDNGILLPDRAVCLEIRDKLFERPQNIILPGIGIFASAYTKEATFYKCGGLGENELSESFQKIFTSIQLAYDKGEDRWEVIKHFQREERNRWMKERFTTAIANISLKDIFDIVTTGIYLARPSGK